MQVYDAQAEVEDILGKPDGLLADAGYFSEDNVKAVSRRKSRCISPITGSGTTSPGMNGSDGQTTVLQMPTRSRSWHTVSRA